MDNKKKLIVFILVFVLLLGGAYVLYSRLGENMSSNQLSSNGVQSQNKITGKDKSNKGDKGKRVEAVDFTVYDIDGEEVKLSDYFGKPIVLNFWASWCGPCQMEMPDFEKNYNKLGKKVQFLMINMTDGSRETVKDASSFIKKKGYTFPVLYDTKYDAAKTYNVYSLPTTYFIDSEGYIITQANGAIDAKTLQQGIDMILP